MLTKARHEDVRKRETLYELFHDTEDCLNNMDDELLDLLEQNLKDFRKKIALKKRSLKQSEFIVLVAGKYK